MHLTVSPVIIAIIVMAVIAAAVVRWNKLPTLTKQEAVGLVTYRLQTLETMFQTYEAKTGYSNSVLFRLKNFWRLVNFLGDEKLSWRIEHNSNGQYRFR